jgi:hypothetical protein
MGDFGATKKAPEKPFPWLAVSMGFLALLIAAPFGYIVYRSTNKELSTLKTVGRGNTLEGDKPEEGISRKPEKAEKAPAAEQEPAVTSRDKVLQAVQSVSQWVPVDWVARTAGVSPEQATDDLTALADEGYLEHASDRGGKPIFRALTG